MASMMTILPTFNNLPLHLKSMNQTSKRGVTTMKINKPLEELYNIKVERQVSKQRLLELNVSKWSVWKTGPTKYLHLPCRSLRKPNCVKPFRFKSVTLSPVRRRRFSVEIMNNAFKAFKAAVPIEWSPHIYITLVRGMPGTRKLHRRTLEALRLRKCNRTVMRWNTPTVRGMLNQVKRLVAIETEAMFVARKKNIVDHRAVRPPLVISHAPPSASSTSS